MDKRIHWRSLAGNVLYCEFLDNEQQNIYKYIGDIYISRFNQYGIIDLNIDESQLNNSRLYINNLQIIMRNGLYVQYNNSDYNLSIDLENINSIVPIYITLTDEINIINDTVLTSYKEPVDLPIYMNKLTISTENMPNSMLLCTIYKNDYGLYTFQYNNCIKSPVKFSSLIDNLCLSMYKYITYAKNAENNRLPMLNLLYSSCINMRYIHNMQDIFTKLSDIFSALVGYDGEIPSLALYNHENNVQLCETLISNIIKVINKQTKSNITLFKKQDTYYSINIGNNILKLEILLEPANDINRNWIENMRIVSKSRLLQARNLRNIGIERSVENVNNSTLIILLNMNSEWLVMNEELCIDIPMNDEIIINNLMLRVSV